MPADEPIAAVVIPAHGRQGQLNDCLRALAAQTLDLRAFEVIVVDDGSAPSLELCPDVIEGGLDVRLVAQVNKGPAAARQAGVALAGARFIAFTDDDCLPRPQWLERLIEALDAHDGAIVGGATVNGLTRNVFSEASNVLLDFLAESFERSRSLKPFFPSNNMAMSRQAFLDIGGFDERFTLAAAEDRELCERWIARGGKLVRVEEALLEHRHGLSLGEFLRQHHNYGRGAARLAQIRREYGRGTPAPEGLGFYWRMLAFPFGRFPFGKAAKISCLIGISQLVMISGIVREMAVRRS
jgi:GT2 family glycosyltransferase